MSVEEGAQVWFDQKARGYTEVNLFIRLRKCARAFTRSYLHQV